MPLLNRKKIPLSNNISYDPKRKRKEVWYLRFTNEVFTSYEAYITRLTLYQQSIWECEVTGKKDLTYEQALESEKLERDRAEFKFCQPIRREILNKVQFRKLAQELWPITIIQNTIEKPTVTH
ncbi:ATP-utilizing chromatin assembly and remodelling N-terminal-domain-containing protein [Mycotypha africana]|uniref:ATP-utilizing chromatin assembly and remodelling N-terminal-domain-containing protein n=1 Tax=Mycotypha africana TaxID=64632 RepID=UPI002300C80D|nr:ATP-utilizing chromatin assembly and remodelling N-terminal-domain-containing protein [Mycotypha africana]KAI8977536.1 ATP-utilizing chromatin assembly and remodelling N-terminal-domain-containing protein [Mycotypha africana]